MAEGEAISSFTERKRMKILNDAQSFIQVLGQGVAVAAPPEAPVCVATNIDIEVSESS
jgi:hypothetical protein